MCVLFMLLFLFLPPDRVFYAFEYKMAIIWL
uniref:Uncharacterized protein n=1 Tax=Rhizophora mucronata TaxID=61149 RepID=A0A2P2PZR3_RHIMU